MLNRTDNTTPLQNASLAAGSGEDGQRNPQRLGAQAIASRPGNSSPRPAQQAGAGGAPSSASLARAGATVLAAATVSTATSGDAPASSRAAGKRPLSPSSWQEQSDSHKRLRLLPRMPLLQALQNEYGDDPRKQFDPAQVTKVTFFDQFKHGRLCIVKAGNKELAMEITDGMQDVHDAYRARETALPSYEALVDAYVREAALLQSLAQEVPALKDLHGTQIDKLVVVSDDLCLIKTTGGQSEMVEVNDRNRETVQELATLHQQRQADDAASTPEKVRARTGAYRLLAAGLQTLPAGDPERGLLLDIAQAEHIAATRQKTQALTTLAWLTSSRSEPAPPDSVSRDGDRLTLVHGDGTETVTMTMQHQRDSADLYDALQEQCAVLEQCAAAEPAAPRRDKGKGRQIIASPSPEPAPGSAHDSPIADTGTTTEDNAAIHPAFTSWDIALQAYDTGVDTQFRDTPTEKTKSGVRNKYRGGVAEFIEWAAKDNAPIGSWTPEYYLARSIAWYDSAVTQEEFVPTDLRTNLNRLGATLFPGHVFDLKRKLVKVDAAPDAIEAEMKRMLDTALQRANVDSASREQYVRCVPAFHAEMVRRGVTYHAGWDHTTLSDNERNIIRDIGEKYIPALHDNKKNYRSGANHLVRVLTTGSTTKAPQSAPRQAPALPRTPAAGTRRFGETVLFDVKGPPGPGQRRR